MDTLQACTTKDKVQEAWRIFGNRKKRPNLLLVAFVKLEANVHEKMNGYIERCLCSIITQACAWLALEWAEQLQKL